MGPRFRGDDNHGFHVFGWADGPWKFPRKSVILSEAKNLHWLALVLNCRSFAALRMAATFITMGRPPSTRNDNSRVSSMSLAS